MFCSMCGKGNDNNSRFCIACGNKLAQPEPSLMEVVEEQLPVVNTEATEPAKVEEAKTETVEVKKAPEEIKEESVAEVKEDDFTEQLIQPVEEIPEIIEESQPEEVIIEESSPIVENIGTSEPESTPEIQNTVEDSEPVEQAEPEEQAVITTETVIKKKGFLSYTGLVFCFILLFTFIVSLMAGIIAKVSINPNQLGKDIDKIDILNIQVGGIISTNEYDVQKDDTILDIVYKTVEKNSDFKISKDDIKKVYEDTEIKDYMAKKVSSYMDYVANGKELDEITTKELVGLIEQNKDKIEEITDINISDSNLNNLESYLDDNASDLMESLKAENIDKNIDKYNYSDYDFIFNNWLWICAFSGLGLLIVLFAFFVFKLNKNAGGSIVYLGSVAISSGALFLIAGIVITIIKGTIADAFEEASGFASSLISIISFRFILVGGIVFVAGLITVLVKKLVCMIRNNKNKPAEEPQLA